MTSGNLFFKLLKEDFKRRTWAVALVFLAFFFTLPIGLSLSMESAANSNYYIYNGYRDFIQDGSIPDALFQEKLLALKTKVVLSQASFGNGMVVFLLIAAAVVIGVSSFSYLHNRKKIDFYHSMPVRREVLYGAQYLGGILIVGIAYAVNLILMMCVSLAYGLPVGSVAGAMTGGFALNMLYFMLMYAVVVVAMMMTGNMVVGILAAGIFFFFIPAVMLLLSGYCGTFFVTTARNLWGSDGSPFMWGMKFLSPFSLYMTALDWGIQGIGKHVPELICTGFAFLAVSILGLQLYRRRPSESAGKAMAFRRTMAPIRMIIVLGSGLAGGLFFWMLQSNLKWGIFGVVVSVIMAHCVIEIIYHFDFKKLFGSRLQLAICLAAGVLVFLSFRYDWYGYDSYLPSEGKIASASLEIDMDSDWLDNRVLTVKDDGSYEMEYRQNYEFIEDNMVLTDMNLVMPIVEAGRKQALESRENLLNGSRSTAVVQTRTVIGGADGPTSVFVAEKVGKGQEQPPAQTYYANVSVCYRLANGRLVRRAYPVYLSDIMDVYDALYDSREYKEGLYDILTRTPGQCSTVYYKEAGSIVYQDEDGSALTGLLEAYQKDFMALKSSKRREQDPIGSICFVTKDSETYFTQGTGDIKSMRRSQYSGNRLEDFNQSYPVYPSFTNTIALLEQQGVKPGTIFSAENTKEIRLNVQNLFYNDDSYEDLPQDEELAELQRINPRYTAEGYLKITDRDEIKGIMDVLVDEDVYRMNRFYLSAGGTIYCEVELESNPDAAGLLLTYRMKPEIMDLFKGLPMNNLDFGG